MTGFRTSNWRTASHLLAGSFGWLAGTLLACVASAQDTTSVYRGLLLESLGLFWGLAVARASVGTRRVRDQGGVTVVGFVMAVLIVAPWARSFANTASVGALFAAVVLLATVLFWFRREARQQRLFPTHDALERAALPSATVLWIGAAALALTFGPHVPFVVLGAAPILFGVALLVWSVRRDARRSRWLDDVARGRVVGWRLVSAPEGQLDRDALSSALPSAENEPTCGMLLRSHDDGPWAPYRELSPATVVAAVGFEGHGRGQRLRARVAKRVTTALFGVFAVIVGVDWAWAKEQRESERARLASSRAAEQSSLDARCRELAERAQGWQLERRLETVPGVARTYVVTHHEDPRLAKGAAQVFVVPRASVATEDALDAVTRRLDASTCGLSFTVKDAGHRPTGVVVSFPVEGGREGPDKFREERIRGALERTFGLLAGTREHDRVARVIESRDYLEKTLAESLRWLDEEECAGCLRVAEGEVTVRVEIEGPYEVPLMLSGLALRPFVLPTAPSGLGSRHPERLRLASGGVSSP